MIRRRPAPEPEAVSPYSRLAEIYDYVMRHVDYAHWADYAESLFVHHDFTPNRLIDLACGTGSLALELRRRLYRVSGADGCAEMLEVAKTKARQAGYEIPFYHKNLLQLEGLPRFEAALCLYDSLNYLMTPEDVSRGIEQVHGLVEPGGLFVFDVCTETNSLRYFRDMTDRDRGDGFSYVRHSFYDRGIQYNRFEIRFEATGEVVRELHQQRIYPLEAVQEAVEASPFELEGMYSGFGHSQPTQQSDRVHFVLRA